MNLTGKLNSFLRPPQITRPRVWLALALAAAADGLQLLLNAVGWFGPDQVIDGVAMILISRVIGFHILLLPTFVLELIPLIDDLPTWTACTAAVIALRKHEQNQNRPSSPPSSPPPLPSPPSKPTVDI